MAPSFEELLAKAKDSTWKLEFGYTLMAVVQHEEVDYVIGKNDWYDDEGKPKQGFIGPMTLIEVLDQNFAHTLLAKIAQVEKDRPVDYTCFFVFGLYALYALLAEGLVRGTLTEKQNGVFEGTLDLDGRKFAFSAFESERPMEGQDFLFVDGSVHPYKIF